MIITYIGDSKSIDGRTLKKFALSKRSACQLIRDGNKIYKTADKMPERYYTPIVNIKQCGAMLVYVFFKDGYYYLEAYSVNNEWRLMERCIKENQYEI